MPTRSRYPDIASEPSESPAHQNETAMLPLFVRLIHDHTTIAHQYPTPSTDGEGFLPKALAFGFASAFILSAWPVSGAIWS